MKKLLGSALAAAAILTTSVLPAEAAPAKRRGENLMWWSIDNGRYFVIDKNKTYWTNDHRGNKMLMMAYSIRDEKNVYMNWLYGRYNTRCIQRDIFKNCMRRVNTTVKHYDMRYSTYRKKYYNVKPIFCGKKVHLPGNTYILPCEQRSLWSLPYKPRY